MLARVSSVRARLPGSPARRGARRRVRYRLVALDLDGTTLDPAGALRPAVARCVAAVRERGVRVVVTTGRRFRTGSPFAAQLGLEGPCVFHHGALVKDVCTGATRARHELSEDLYRSVVDALGDHGAPLVYVDGYPDAEDIVTIDRGHAHPLHRRYLDENRTLHRLVDDLSAPLVEGPMVVALLHDESRLRVLREELLGAFEGRVEVGVHPTYLGCHLLELLGSGVSKWTALREIAADDGIAPDAILAIGDESNDLEMLRCAGLGVAMGNAPEAVKDVADHVTASNAEDGVAATLRRFILDA